MLQRTTLRASRQASRPTSAFAPLRQQLVSTRVATAPAIRWYSDAPAAKEGEAAEKKEDAPVANDAAAGLKADVEKKTKEIVELKVPSHSLQSHTAVY
jgi:molecular chaperone GrpE